MSTAASSTAGQRSAAKRSAAQHAPPMFHARSPSIKPWAMVKLVSRSAPGYRGEFGKRNRSAGGCRQADCHSCMARHAGQRVAECQEAGEAENWHVVAVERSSSVARA